MPSVPLNLQLCTHRYALIVSYIGSRYHGSQRLVSRKQTGNQETIQEALEVSLETVFPRDKCRLTAGSRTDKGVHSLMSCYTLPLMDFSCPTEKIKRSSNLYLMKRNHEIVVNEVILAPADFHPRKSAVSREYIYRIGVPKNHRLLIGEMNKVRFFELFGSFPASEQFRLLPLPSLDLAKAERAANIFRGEHDFATFSHDTDEKSDTIRSLELDIVPANDMAFEHEHSSLYDIYHFHFKSRAFLYNQIRRIMGAIITYASFDRDSLDSIQDLIDKPDPNSWPPHFLIAEPWGLYLSRMNYNKSSFEGTKRTYEDKTEVVVPVDTIPGAIEMSDDLIGIGEKDSNNRVDY